MLSPITEFDRTLSLWIHAQAQPWLDTGMKAITRGGDWRTLFLFTLLCGAFFFFRQRRKREPALLLLAFSLSYLINPLLKHLVQRERPQLWATLIARPSDFSFPSGHAMSAMTVYGLAAWLLARTHPQQRWGFRLCAAVMIVLIGFSRVYLGVHWTTDVLAGFLVGAMLVYACAVLIRHADRHSAR